MYRGDTIKSWKERTTRDFVSNLMGGPSVERSETRNIMKCFRNGGVLDSDLCVSSMDDPFQDIDVTVEMSTLISSAMGGANNANNCSADEYVNGDN